MDKNIPNKHWEVSGLPKKGEFVITPEMADLVEQILWELNENNIGPELGKPVKEGEILNLIEYAVSRAGELGKGKNDNNPQKSEPSIKDKV